MSFYVGSALKLKLPFADGPVAKYPRYFLVVDVDNNFVYCLNCSSVRGKEDKLAMPSNVLINQFNPPFFEATFTKIDYIYKIPRTQHLKSFIFKNGAKLVNTEMDKILSELAAYQSEIFEIEWSVFSTYNVS